MSVFWSPGLLLSVRGLIICNLKAATSGLDDGVGMINKEEDNRSSYDRRLYVGRG